MTARTQAEVVFSGSGGLDKLLEKLNSGIKNFGTSSGKTTKELLKLNKETKITDGLFKSLKNNVTGVGDGLVGLGRKGRNSVNLIKDLGTNTINLSDSLYEANRGLSGLGLRFLGVRDEAKKLDAILVGPAQHFADIAFASSNTERAFIILNKVSAPLRATLSFMSDQAVKLGQAFVSLEQFTVSFVKKGVDIANRGLSLLSKTFSAISVDIKNFGLFGRIVSKQLAGVSASMDIATKRAAAFAKSLDPKELERVDKVGNALSKTFLRIGGGLERAATGVLLADALGDGVRVITGFGRKIEDTKDLAIDLGDAGVDAGKKFAFIWNVANTRLNTVAIGVRKVGQVLGDAAFKGVGDFIDKINIAVIAVSSLATVAVGVGDAIIKASGLSDAFAQIQTLGIDTSAAEIAFQFGLVGEKLLFSAEAAREFARVAIASFAQTEDAAGFVTTLSAGANLQFGEMAEGIQSVSAFTRELSNDLNNAATSVEVSGALYNTLSAGIGVTADNTVDLTQANNFLNASLKLSSGTGADAAGTLDLLAKVTTVYGLSANEAAVTASKLNQVVERGQVTFSQLTNNLGRTASVAQATGVSLDETLASVSALTKIQGAEAQQGLASLLSAITGQGEQSKKTVQELGVQFDLNAVKTKGLNQALQDLNEAAGGNAETLKRVIPDILAFQTAQALIGPVAQDVQSNLEAMSSTAVTSGEALDNVFAAGQQSTIKQFSNLMNGFNEVLVDFGQRTLPALAPGVALLENLLEFLRNMPEPLKDIIGLIVITKTVSSALISGFVSLALTIGSVIATYVALNLISKTLNGQLGVELRVIRQLIEEEKDWGGALARLVGLNKDLSISNKAVTESTKKVEQALKGLESLNIDPGDRSLDSLKASLKEIRQRIKDFKNDPINLIDPAEAEKQISELRRIRSEVTSAVKAVGLSQKVVLDELPKTIDKILKDGTRSVSARVNNFQQVIESIVSPRMIGERGEEFQAVVKNLFDKSLSDAETTTNQKLLDISNTFKVLQDNATPELKKYLVSVEKQLLNGTARLANSTEPVQKAIKDSIKTLRDTLPQEVSMAFDKAVERQRAGLENMESSAKARKRSLSKVYAETLNALPEEAQKIGPKLKNAIDNFLNDNTRTLEDRSERLFKTISNAARDLDPELKIQLQNVTNSVVGITSALEVEVSESGLLSDLLTRQAVGIRKSAGQLQNAGESIRGGLGFIKEIIRTEGNDLLEGSDYGQVVKKIGTDLISAAKELPGTVQRQFIGASAGLTVAFDTLIDSDAISAKARSSLNEVKDEIANNLRSFSVGEVNLTQFEDAFEKSKAKVVQTLFELGQPQLIKPFIDNIDKVDLGALESRFNTSVEKLNAAIDSIADEEVRNEIANNLEKITFQNIESESRRTAVQINAYLESVGGDETKSQIVQNLNELENEIEKFGKVEIQTAPAIGNLDKLQTKSKETGQAGSKAFSGMRDTLDGLAGTIGQTNPKLGAVLSGMSSFLTSAGELKEGGTKLFGGLTEAMDKSSDATKSLGLINRDFAANLVQSTAVTATQTTQTSALGTATIFGAKANALWGKTMIGARTAAATTIPVIGLAGSTFAAAATAAWGFISAAAVALAPFIAIGAAIAAVVVVLGEYVGWIGRIIDADQRFAAQSEKTNKELEVSIDLLKEYNRDASRFRDATGENTKSLKEMKESLEVNRLDPQTLIPEKEFVTGWQRALIFPAEAIAMGFRGLQSNVLKFGLGTIKVFARIGQFATQHIPIVGNLFKKAGDGAKQMAEDVELGSSASEGKIRKFFNNIRKTVQDARSADTREAVAASILQADALIKETERVTQISEEQFGVASTRARQIMALAAENNRALSSEELKEVLKEENALADISLETLNERISAKEKELEAIKDPTARAVMEQELDLLRNQTSELEKQRDLRIEFLNNQQAIATSLDNSNAARNTEASLARVQRIFQELGENANGQEAQNLFAQINGLEIETNEAGERILQIGENTLSTASLASRNASIALQSSISAFSNNVANLENEALNLTQDDLAVSLMNVISGVSRQLEEDPAFADEGAAIINSLLTTNVEALTANGEAFGALTAAQQREVFEAQSSIFEAQLEQESKIAEESIKNIQVLRENGTKTQLEAIKETGVQQEILDQAQLDFLNRQLAAARQLQGPESEAAKDAARAVADFTNQMTLNAAKVRRDVFEEELKQLQLKQDNELKALENIAEKEKGIAELRQKSIEQEQKSLQSKQDLTNAINTFEETLLQNKLKLTTDVEEKAQIEVELAEQRLEMLDSEIEFERSNLILQQDLNQLAMEREQIELRIQKAEIASQQLINQNKIDNAAINNLSEAEVTALNLQNEALATQSQLLTDTQDQLRTFAAEQAEMDDRALQALDLRQQAQRSTAEVNLELALRNQVIASLEKEVEIIKLQAREVEVLNQERTVGLENATALLQQQTNILEEQKEFLNNMTGIIQQNFQIAISAERNEFRKRRLEEEAARAKLEALRAQQAIELEIFRINEQQKDLALEVRQIELAAAREKAAADIAVAEAELAKTQADPNATAEAIAAAELNIRAAQAQLSATEAQSELIAQERAVNARGAGLRDLQFRQQQEQALTQQEFAVAQTTRRRSDDRQIARQALDRARNLEDEFANAANTFLTTLRQPQAISNINPVLNGPQLPTQTLATNGQAAEQKLQGMVDLNLNINVGGNTDAVDPEELKRAAASTVEDGLFELFDGITIRTRN